MKTFDLTLKTVELKNENTVSNIILGTYDTIEEAKASRANKVYDMRKDINAESIYAMEDGSQMITDSENGYIFIIEEHKTTQLDEEMALWEARANDEFGKTLKEINEKAFNEWFTEDDENGISSTPISHHITAYALDGNRKHTANVIRNIIEDYDMMEDVKELVKKMMKLAA